jgi:hypothetical protein
VLVIAVSITPLCILQWCQWYRSACHSANDTDVHATEVSMPPLCNFVKYIPVWSNT